MGRAQIRLLSFVIGFHLPLCPITKVIYRYYLLSSRYDFSWPLLFPSWGTLWWRHSYCGAVLWPVPQARNRCGVTLPEVNISRTVTWNWERWCGSHTLCLPSRPVLLSPENIISPAIPAPHTQKKQPALNSTNEIQLSAELWQTGARCGLTAWIFI